MAFDRTGLLCFACLPDKHSFAERIRATADAGFTELSFWLLLLPRRLRSCVRVRFGKGCVQNWWKLFHQLVFTLSSPSFLGLSLDLRMTASSMPW